MCAVYGQLLSLAKTGSETRGAGEEQKEGKRYVIAWG